MYLVGSIIEFVLFVFLALLFIRLVVDWVQVFARSWTPKGPVLVVLEVVYSITDPPIMFVRRFVPPLRIGSVALDTSFLIVLVVVYLLRILNRHDLLRRLEPARRAGAGVTPERNPVGSPRQDSHRPDSSGSGLPEYGGRSGGDATDTQRLRTKG